MRRHLWFISVSRVKQQKILTPIFRKGYGSEWGAGTVHTMAGVQPSLKIRSLKNKQAEARTWIPLASSLSSLQSSWSVFLYSPLFLPETVTSHSLFLLALNSYSWLVIMKFHSLPLTLTYFVVASSALKISVKQAKRSLHHHRSGGTGVSVIQSSRFLASNGASGSGNDLNIKCVTLWPWNIDLGWNFFRVKFCAWPDIYGQCE